uniref:serine carboxypeptidase-like 13 isoform X2 n=1 Tax=Erigeron canadensis TaxID=72917 RepID=UPI001CB9AEED|nr:serine carboxypeptidase-like 13 isoform X2 [Erigeron canadensis]
MAKVNISYSEMQIISTMKPLSQYHLQKWNLFKKPSSQISQMLLLVFLLIVSLDVIESQFRVKSLPGFDGDLPFTLETGYIGVGDLDDVQLFYYFIESEGNPKEDPLMLWLTGGPGCSALSGLLFEIGPFTFDYAKSTLENPILEINPYSWTKAASIIFLDQPAGSGFSYARSPHAYITNDTMSAMHAYNFLKKWLVDHPKFLNNALYLGGDSYMGIVLPMIVQEIYNGNKDKEGMKINLKGYILGNPITDTSGDYNAKIPFAHRMALLSDAIYKCIGQIYKPHILEPQCETTNALKYDLFRRVLRALDNTSGNILGLPEVQIQGCRDDNYLYSCAWANRRDVREAFHISEEFSDIEWVRCNETLLFNYGEEAISYTHNVLSTVDYHRRFADKTCRALIYSGDHDMIVPYLGTLKWIQSLNLSVLNDWRPWFVDKQVAGYMIKYSKDDYNLTFATVKGGGHTAPEYKPKECLTMLMRWFVNDTL